MDIKQFLMEALVARDDARARSTQTEIGPSQIGGCRAEVWLASRGVAGSNSTRRLPAVMGTAIHAAIEGALAQQGGVLLEQTVSNGVLTGHVDCYISAERLLIDWKTTKASNLASFPSRQQRWQVQLYASLMNESGYPVDEVALVAIPRDGDELDILVHREPADSQIAAEAYGWLASVTESPTQPAPERDTVSWCQHYCKFYGSACMGRSKSDTNMLIDDPWAQDAARTYVKLGQQIKALEGEQKAAREALVGVSGRTDDGVTVAWTEVAGRSTVDEDAVKAVMGEVPKKQGSPSMRLVVK